MSSTVYTHNVATAKAETQKQATEKLVDIPTPFGEGMINDCAENKHPTVVANSSINVTPRGCGSCNCHCETMA